MATNAYTYDDKANKEDLLDLITNLDYNETQLFNGLADGNADGVLHQWLKDTLKTPGDNKKVEGADAVNKTITNPSRLTNYCQILDNTYSVTGTERAVDTAGFDDRLTYEREKGMKEFKQDVEFSLMRGALATGTGSAARSMRGVKAWLSNVTSQSGTSLTETMLNDYFQNVWDGGIEVDAIYAPMYLKRKISGFTAGSTKNVNSIDRRLVNAVDVYEADAAQMVKLFAHRYVTQSADTNNDFIGINESMFSKAWLRKPKVEKLAKTGDSDREQLLGELTLVCKHEDAGFLTKAVL